MTVRSVASLLALVSLLSAVALVVLSQQHRARSAQAAARRDFVESLSAARDAANADRMTLAAGAVCVLSASVAVASRRKSRSPRVLT